jgi:hypothetical protein
MDEGVDRGKGCHLDHGGRLMVDLLGFAAAILVVAALIAGAIS